MTGLFAVDSSSPNKMRRYKKLYDYCKRGHNMAETRSRNKKTGKNPYCSECRKINTLEYFKRHPERRKKYSWKSMCLKKHDLSIEDFDKMVIGQDNKCAICFKTFDYPRKKPSIDHCHVTNRVRGLLCSNCNTGIGLLKEDKTIFLSAMSYLEKHRAI